MSFFFFCVVTHVCIKRKAGYWKSVGVLEDISATSDCGCDKNMWLVLFPMAACNKELGFDVPVDEEC